MSDFSTFPRELYPLFADFLDYNSIIMLCSSCKMICDTIINNIQFWKSRITSKGYKSSISDLSTHELRKVSKLSEYILKGNSTTERNLRRDEFEFENGEINVASTLYLWFAVPKHVYSKTCNFLNVEDTIELLKSENSR